MYLRTIARISSLARRYSYQSPEEELLRTSTALRRKLVKVEAERIRLTRMLAMVDRTKDTLHKLPLDEQTRQVFLLKEWLNSE